MPSDSQSSTTLMSKLNLPALDFEDNSAIEMEQ